MNKYLNLNYYIRDKNEFIPSKTTLNKIFKYIRIINK